MSKKDKKDAGAGAIKKPNISTGVPDKALVKKVHTPEVLPKGMASSLALSDESKAKFNGIIAQVKEDIGGAELGQFFALRAGIGLLATKDFIPHGSWMSEIAEAFKYKSGRTIRRYVANAEKFCDAYNITAAMAWTKLSGIDRKFLERAATQLLFGMQSNDDKINKNDIPKEVKWMSEFLEGDKDGEPKKKDDEKPMTPEERIALAEAYWKQVIDSASVTPETMKKLSLLGADTADSIGTALKANANTIIQLAAKLKKKLG